jgi:hypothetical protein
VRFAAVPGYSVLAWVRTAETRWRWLSAPAFAVAALKRTSHGHIGFRGFATMANLLLPVTAPTYSPVSENGRSLSEPADPLSAISLERLNSPISQAEL